jgi:hypothetical protein
MLEETKYQNPDQDQKIMCITANKSIKNINLSIGQTNDLIEHVSAKIIEYTNITAPPEVIQANAINLQNLVASLQQLMTLRDATHANICKCP